MFTVELVGIGMLREFGVVLTAILLAGRTDSAFTAQIGAMKMRQEIDAMRIIGIDPMEALVAPRLIALLIMTPMLTFAAMMAGIFGGLVAAWTRHGHLADAVHRALPGRRCPSSISGSASSRRRCSRIVLALIGCRQGMLVEGDVVSLGRRTTSSVVQSIFLVIAIDALFAILWFQLNV